MRDRDMKILHIFRAPVGGLFRHVRDLASEQARAGHEVGLICDSRTGGEMSERALDELAPALSLGIMRVPMPRLPGPADLSALHSVRRHVADTDADILHGHGAKGGLYARLSRNTAKAVYTAHGGSLHYSWKTPHGALFLGVEKTMLSRTDGVIFVCDYERRTFEEKIGRVKCAHAIIHNGLREDEFAPVTSRPDAADILFVGELRMLKGVDVLIEALARLRDGGRPVTALIVGDGPDREEFVELVERRNLADLVRMPGAMPAREAFPSGKVMVVPSRAESFPYIVLEAQAAGLPLIASNVGGIPEMTEPEMLVPPDDSAALADRITTVLDDPAARKLAAERIPTLKKRFSIANMADRALEFYASLTGTRE